MGVIVLRGNCPTRVMVHGGSFQGVVVPGVVVPRVVVLSPLWSILQEPIESQTAHILVHFHTFLTKYGNHTAINKLPD